MSLPRSTEDLRGRRAAIWIRESTRGQYLNSGPDAQRAMVTAAIDRLGMVPTGLEWQAAQSGHSVYRSPEMAGVIEAARAGRFEVLTVAYAARWQRNLRQTLNLLEEQLHPLGAAVFFVDENIVSSNDRDWDGLVDEAKAAESWLRKHRRRVHEGLAAKLAMKRDPGGHPPYGFRRNAARIVEPDPEGGEAVQQVFALAASGMTDRLVAQAVGLPLFTVRGMLTSPLYIGRLRDGGPANWPALIDHDTWHAVQDQRHRRATNTGRPASPSRPYALRMLTCAACGSRLTGDTNYYRHRDACDAFIAAAPPRPPGSRGRRPGMGYRRESVEDLVGALLTKVCVDDTVIADVVSAIGRQAQVPDPVAQARIGQQRDAAVRRYLADRDTRGLEAAMSRLDAEEVQAREVRVVESVPADFVVKSLRNLAVTWTKAAGGLGRRGLAEALFAEIKLLGMTEMEVSLTDSAVARGLGAALPESMTLIVGNGRGERI